MKIQLESGTTVEDDATEVEEVDETKAEESVEEPETEETEEQPGTDTAADDEVVISFGDEPEAEDEVSEAESSVIRRLRDEYKQTKREAKEKDRRIAELEAKQTPAVVTEVEPEPTLEGCGYDEDVFKAKVLKRVAQQHAQEQKRLADAESEKQQQEQWKARIAAVNKAASGLKVKDFEDAREVFEEILPPTYQGIIRGAIEDVDEAARFEYAVGKNPKLARELASIKDPAKFIFRVADLKAQMKTVTRKVVPAPERVVRSSVGGASASTSQLDKLREKAAKTGDLSDLMAHKRAMRKKA